MDSPALPDLAAAAHLLCHAELADRSGPYLRPEGIDWPRVCGIPPWSTREERVIRAAADLCGAPPESGVEPLRLSELADASLWDPAPYSPRAEDHSHRVLEALGIRRGWSLPRARAWLGERYDIVVRVLDVWEWGALPTGVDPAGHILASRVLAGRAERHLFLRSPARVFESLAGEQWEPAQAIVVDCARALSGLGAGPTLAELASLSDEELAVVVEGLYIAWQQG